MKTPESERLSAWGSDLDKLVDRVQQLAAESTEFDVQLLHLCTIAHDLQHWTRRTIALMEA
jgi:hypothetical protein